MRLINFFAASVSISILLSGCAQNTQPKEQIEKQKQQEEQIKEEQKLSSKPSWLYEGLVGSAKITASGNLNEQKRLALERAIYELLMMKGEITGQSVGIMQKSLSQENGKDSFNTRYNSSTDISIEYNKKPFHINVKNFWVDPKSEEMFIQIEEVK